MEKDKSRGIKHIKDKRKYKGNSTKDPKHVPLKSQPNLESNWDRYEVTKKDHEHKLSSSTDFALLSNASISIGSHFQFKSDKSSEEYAQRENALFSLNLDLLHKSILTVPFYERLNIPKEYFKEKEINAMNENAAKSLESYQQDFIETHKVSDLIPPNTSHSDDSVINNEDIELAMENFTITDGLQNDDNISELIETVSNDDDHKGLHVPVDSQHKEDLEQWLDDILED